MFRATFFSICTRSRVRVVRSRRAGLGKSLKARRLGDAVEKLFPNSYERIDLHQKHLNIAEIVKRLVGFTEMPENPKPRLFHLNIAHEVRFNSHNFNLWLMCFIVLFYRFRRASTTSCLVSSFSVASVIVRATCGVAPSMTCTSLKQCQSCDK